jgi:hypothetical protein
MSPSESRPLQLARYHYFAAELQGMTALGAAMDRSLIVGIAYGLLISLMLGGIELFVMEGPMLVWLSAANAIPAIIPAATMPESNRSFLSSLAFIRPSSGCRAKRGNMRTCNKVSATR